MKNFKFLMIGVLFLGFAGLSSCKKEDRIEKNLWRGDGTWNIDVFELKETSTYFESDNNESYYQNTGTIQFKKDGTGSFNFMGIPSPITYSNTDKVLTIIFKDVSGDTQYDEIQTFEMDWKKNKMDLSSFIKETYNTSDGQGGTVNVTYTNSLKMKLSKK